VTANVVSGSHRLPDTLPATAPHLPETKEPTLGIEVPEFNFAFATALTDMDLNDDYRVVTVEALLYPGLTMLVTLKTQVTDTSAISRSQKSL
jgi:hypothetical protein